MPRRRAVATASAFSNPALYHLATADPDAFADVPPVATTSTRLPGSRQAPAMTWRRASAPPPRRSARISAVPPCTLRPPSAKTSTAGRFASLRLRASTAPGEEVIFAASGLPTGMKLYRSTGRIYGTPTGAGRWRITATATASAGGGATTAFDWVVRAANSSRASAWPGTRSLTAPAIATTGRDRSGAALR